MQKPIINTRSLTDNWILQVIAKFLSGKESPNEDWEIITPNSESAHIGVIKSGVFQIESLLTFIEQILFIDELYLISDWVPTWYHCDSDLNDLITEKDNSIIKTISTKNINYENKETWLSSLFTNDFIKTQYEQGMQDFRNQKPNYWSQVINGLADYLTISSNQNLSYQPHPARYGYLRSTMWSKEEVERKIQLAGVRQFNKLLCDGHLNLRKRNNTEGFLFSELNAVLPSAGILCLAESKFSSPIKTALQLRDEEEVKQLRKILFNLSISLNESELGSFEHLKESKFMIDTFKDLINKVSKKLSIPTSLGGNNKAEFINMEMFNYRKINDSSLQHNGLMTRLMKVGLSKYSSIIKESLKIDNPIVYKQLDEWISPTILNKGNVSTVNQNFNIIMKKEEYTNYGQVGSMGSNAQTSNSNFNQNVTNTSLGDIAGDIDVLMKYMKNNADSKTKKEVCADVENAKKEILRGNKDKALKHLKNGGKWLLDCSTKIGTGLVTAFLKGELNL